MKIFILDEISFDRTIQCSALPFEFRREASARPARICVGLEITRVRHRLGSVTVMTNGDCCLLEINELIGTPRPAVGTPQWGVPTSKNWIERILREHVLDIRDEQFLMLLFMMNAENKDRLDFIQ